jgi:hypothetical protein
MYDIQISFSLLNQNLKKLGIILFTNISWLKEEKNDQNGVIQ